MENDSFGKAMDQGRVQEVCQQTENKTRFLHPWPFGGRQMFRPTGQDRQTIGFTGQGKGKGVVIDEAVDDRRQGPANGFRCVLSLVCCGNVCLRQRTVALLRFRLQPSRETPGPGGSADKPERLPFSERSFPNQRQIETACHQPAGTARGTEIGRNPVQAELACTDEFIGRFPPP